MKLTKFMLGAGLITALALTSCSSDEPINGNENISDGSTRYMTVNICDNNLGTRASDYEDGEAYESGVQKVRFFFFDDKLNGVAVKAGQQVNSYDVVPKQEVTPENENISNIVTCDIIISTKDGDKLPSNIVAVTNYGSWLQENYDALTDLIDDVYVASIAGDPTTGPVEVAKGDFPMCNSVYLDNAGQLQFVTPVRAENICHEEDAARANPVNLFVERTVAKVVGDFSDTFKAGAAKVAGYEFVVPAKDDKGAAITDASGNQLYVGVNGWSVTGTTQYAKLVKEISTTWTNSNIMGNEGIVFNVPSYRRCFWEKNEWAKVAPYDPVNYPLGLQYNTWSDAGKYKFDPAAEDYQRVAYVNPNAGTQDDGTHTSTYITSLIGNKTLTGEYDNGRTQVIVKATLLVKNGDAYEPVSLANWLGTYYSFNDLKKAMAGYVSHTIYYADVAPEGGKVPAGTKLNSIEVEDLVLRTHGQGASVRVGETRRYPVYAQLSITAPTKDKYWYDAAGNALTVAQVNSLLVATEPAKAWTEGATYYYFDLGHLGAKGSKAEYGVVRNHVYKFTISDIKGLGTPVYDPDEIIIPEKPKDQLGYIAATINVLSWRIVNQEVVLE